MSGAVHVQNALLSLWGQECRPLSTRSSQQNISMLYLLILSLSMNLNIVNAAEAAGIWGGWSQNVWVTMSLCSDSIVLPIRPAVYLHSQVSHTHLRHSSASAFRADYATWHTLIIKVTFPVGAVQVRLPHCLHLSADSSRPSVCSGILTKNKNPSYRKRGGGICSSWAVLYLTNNWD